MSKIKNAYFAQIEEQTWKWSEYQEMEIEKNGRN
jgi:hypothetical protein